MKNTNKIPENIRDFLEYDETSPSFLRWKKIDRIRRKINIGDPVGILNNKGYYVVRVNNIFYKNHRIIFFLHHGYCPDIVDHIDNNNSNNNINNLREATSSQNNHNSRIPKNNKTGVKGLCTHQEKYWRLQIRKNRKIGFQEYHLKTDKTKDECRIILEQKRKEIHGQFSNNG